MTELDHHREIEGPQNTVFGILSFDIANYISAVHADKQIYSEFLETP